MRMFLIGMTDIFLILYLTSLTSVRPTSTLTVEDFLKLKTMHTTLAAEKKKLAVQLTEEEARREKAEASLAVRDTTLKEISEDLQTKENMLQSREQLLAELNRKIATKEEELQAQKETVQASQARVKKFALAAQKAQYLADQMQQEANQAHRTAETAVAVQKNAIQLKDKALDEKAKAERRVEEALAARLKAEAEKKKALAAAAEARQKAQEAQQQTEQAEQKAQKLAVTIRDIKQEGDQAYQRHIRPQLQTLKVTYERQVNDNTLIYKREFTLLPVKIGDRTVVLFPSRQAGFTSRSDTAPERLTITYAEKKITQGWIDKEDDLLAVSLPGYAGGAYAPYPSREDVAQFMPALLALRNNGNRSLGAKIRGLSDEYFIVNRDYLEPTEDAGLKYTVSGFRGTGTHGERILRGDQLVDLNGRLIGVANEDNKIIRVDTLSDWKERTF